MSSTCTRTLAITGLVVAAAFVACSQPRQTGILPVGALGDTDPIAAIIERRPELQLADSQVDVLRVLKRDLERVNRPLRDELERMGLLRPPEGMRRVPETPTKEQQERAKPLIAEMRENNKRARDAAVALLNAMQRTKLDSLEKAVRTRRQDGPRRGTPPSV